ncbi:hypothetical protein F5X97DRAFT_321451 [Nemania serpens]|nr:hypothetical protein F5X97DRAFT_321451 [Nemania serpens]
MEMLFLSLVAACGGIPQGDTHEVYTDIYVYYWSMWQYADKREQHFLRIVVGDDVHDVMLEDRLPRQSRCFKLLLLCCRLCGEISIQ